jgi:ribonucleoside-diphosphate reductase beta chain
VQLERKKIYNENGQRGTQRLIGGSTTNIREWNRAKYDWADKLRKIMLKNFWVAEEVAMTKDATQFSKLTSAERRAFDKFISFLNFLDSIQCENLDFLKEYVTAPEVSSLLTIQAFQEEIHAQSYSYVLDTVCEPATRDKIYDEWRNDSLMFERNKFIADIYQDFIDNPTDRNFVRSCMGNFLLESLYFYSAFTFFYALARNNKMINTASMIKLIQRDELTHVVLFQNIFIELQKENPELFTDEFKEELKQMVRTAVDWETRFGHHVMNNEIEGLNQEILGRYIKYLANNRMKRIGWEPLYPEITEHPMKWVENFEDQNNTKQDFFQTTVTNYQKTNDKNWDDL